MLNPYWLQTAAKPNYPSLDKDITADVLVIGAGITGLTAAYLLAKEGVKVTVVDSNNIIRGNTGHTTAHLSWFLDSSYSEIMRVHGAAHARKVLESHRWAIDFIEDTAKEHGMNCHFARAEGRLFLKSGDSMETLEKQKEGIDRLENGLVHILDKPEPGAGYQGPALVFPNQGRFHPGLFFNGLAREIVKFGGQIFTNTAVDKIEAERVTTQNRMKIEASHIIVAAHSTIHARFFPAKETPYMTYAIAAPVPKGSLNDCLYWDTEEPYHYVRIDKAGDKDYLIAGGEDHKAGQIADERKCLQRLEAWTRRQYPFVESISHSWSGQVLETMDGLAYIGRMPGHGQTYAATGFSGNGMTYGPIAGKILSDLVRGRKSEWAEVYEPSRKPLKSLPDFVGHNLDVVRVFTKDWMHKEEIQHPEDLAADEGAVVTCDHKKVACYRDPHGELHAFSAVCPHLKCVVHWNAAEKTFDCPCHGSRFMPDGSVLEGPATKALARAEIPAPHLK